MQKIIATALVTICTATLLADEARYDGRTAGEWIAKANSSDWVDQSQAAEALGHFDPDTPGLFQALVRVLQVPEAAIHAANSIVGIAQRHPEKTGLCIEVLMRALNQQESAIGLDAEYALAEIAKGSDKVVPGLIEAMKSKDPRRRQGAADTFRQIPGAGPEAVATLITLLNDRDYRVKWAAADGLGGIGANARAAIPALIQTLKDSEPIAAEKAAHAIGSIAAEPDTSVPALVAALADKRVAAAAARALAEFGENAKAALPQLRELVKCSEGGVDAAASYAVSKIGGDEDVTAAANSILRRMRDEPPRILRGPCDIGGWGSRTVFQFRSLGPATVPVLIEAMRNDSANIRAAAAQALGQFGGPGYPFDRIARDAKDIPKPISEARTAVPSLEKALEDEAAIVRVSAALALWLITKEKERSASVLNKDVQGDDPNVRAGAAYGLFRMGLRGQSPSEAIRSVTTKPARCL